MTYVTPSAIGNLWTAPVGRFTRARPPNTYSKAVRGQRKRLTPRPDGLAEASEGDAKKNRTNQGEGEELRSDGSHACPAIQNALGHGRALF
jgi:hypothetical protein